MFPRPAAYLAVFLSFLPMALPVQAGPAEDLLEALKIDEIIEIMREEGRGYSTDMAQDLLPAGQTAGWQRSVDRLYAPDAMAEVVRARFLESFGDTDAAPLLDYFTSPEGQKVVTLEIEARREMISESVEAAAREAWRERSVAGEPRLDQLDRFVAANDLLETNVVGALNASFQFYLGLVDGGGLEMTEPEIVEEVWMQEEATRVDTGEWLYSYLLLAYQPLSDQALDDYIDISQTPEGKAMNQALFAGFNHMYEEISYGLGLAAAHEMLGQEL
ncbi:DUF2059 domain-containing protein [Salipiger mangrovisoli]|uniref:DUF2059 domain-containing protein n=1 Tax=Salipiger mangrovisoli TaxID=2865933 RepID=A0ABR9WWZ3_9RHOB|nr:DUF2059 domain-containing protein [Salipiger mangrovisoli]MBE9635804.1 DUF2059 domain-containing protein [Salipiger mangrovisoli]